MITELKAKIATLERYVEYIQTKNFSEYSTIEVFRFKYELKKSLAEIKKLKKHLNK